MQPSLFIRNISSLLNSLVCFFLGGGVDVVVVVLLCFVVLGVFFCRKLYPLEMETLSYHLRAWYVTSPLEPLCHSSIPC